MKKIVLVLAAMLSTSAHAVTCNGEYIKYVQIKADGEVIYLTQSGIRRGLGNISNPAVVMMAQSMLLSVEKDVKVQVSYPESFNCSAKDAMAKANWVIVQNVSDR